MKRRKRTGAEMRILQSEAAMGLWNLSGSGFHSTLSPRDGKNLIKAAYRAGIRTFDTAFSYGEADSLLHAAMRELGVNDITVISKVMPVPTLRKKVETILRRLGTDSVSILLLHWPAEDPLLERSMEELLRLKKEGKAEAVGVSNFPPDLLKKTAETFPIEYHERALSLLWSKGWEEEKNAGLRTIAYSPLGMGLLSGKYRDRASIPDKRRDLPFFTSPAFLHLIDTLDGDLSAALSWVYSQSPWCVVSGFRNAEDLKILDSVRKLDGDEMKELSRLSAEIAAASGADNIFAHDWH